jgi:hypothetical protein
VPGSGSLDRRPLTTGFSIRQTRPLGTRLDDLEHDSLGELLLERTHGRKSTAARMLLDYVDSRLLLANARGESGRCHDAGSDDEMAKAVALRLRQSP